MSTLIKVGMADYKFSRNPDSLITYGLGSCVGIALYDPVTKIGGLAHIMLPNSKEMNSPTNKAKFADTAIDALIDEILAAGVRKNNIVAKIAGGAQMFSFTGSSNTMKIGEKNVIAVKASLQRHNIRILAEDTGGNFGRTVQLDLTNGEYSIRTIKKGQSAI